MTIITDNEIVQKRCFFSHALERGFCIDCSTPVHSASHVWCGTEEGYISTWGTRYGMPEDYTICD